MRTSEFYACQIHGFFVGWGIDALEQHWDAEAATVDRLAADRDDDDACRFEDDGHCGCSCAVYAPCHHCENDHDAIGCEASA